MSQRPLLFALFCISTLLVSFVAVIAAVAFLLPAEFPEDKPPPASGEQKETQEARAAATTDAKITNATGVEGIVSQIALAAYDRDFEILRRHATPELKDHYNGPKTFERRVGKSLRGAPEVPPGEARVIEAAPANLFGKAIFYQVAVEDDKGDEHVLGIVLKEPPEDAATELTYCYLYVENEHIGDPGEKAGLWRDLVGTQDTCLPQKGGERDLEESLTAALDGRPERIVL